MRGTKKIVGQKGERAVAKCLEQRGFRILDFNLRTTYGEVDILAVKDGVLHAVEVKTRRSASFGGATEALTRRQFLRIKKSVQHLRQNVPALSLGKYQIDFVALQLGGRPRQHVSFFWNVSYDDLI